MKRICFPSSWLMLLSITNLVLVHGSHNQKAKGIHIVHDNNDTNMKSTGNSPPPTKGSSSLGGEFTFAKTMCALRARASESKNNPYHEPLAKLFAGEALVDRLKKVMGETEGRNQVDRFVARHMIIEKMIHDTAYENGLNGPKQVIIFGAGFDTRANRFADILPIQKWFEIDLPEPQQYKVQTLKKYQISDPHNLIRISANFTDSTDSWYDKLQEAGWDPSAPTIFILEGLIYYLKTEEVRALLSSIPDVPNSKIILTIIEESLLRQYNKYASGTSRTWKTNLKELNKGQVLKFRNYKLKRSIGTFYPGQIGLKVWVQKGFLFKVNLWDRIRNFFHFPLERVLEYEASY